MRSEERGAVVGLRVAMPTALTFLELGCQLPEREPASLLTLMEATWYTRFLLLHHYIAVQDIHCDYSPFAHILRF